VGVSGAGEVRGFCHPQDDEARKALTEGMRECRCPITVDVFTDSELAVNVMKELELVPEHKILSLADKRELLRKYHVTEAQLPLILITGASRPLLARRPLHRAHIIADPVSKFIGLKKGQVVRITRDSLTAGRYVTYRICT
jgi:DNA-directed RNA polymerase I, II, and III subunit RPABC1